MFINPRTRNWTRSSFPVPISTFDTKFCIYRLSHISCIRTYYSELLDNAHSASWRVQWVIFSWMAFHNVEEFFSSNPQNLAVFTSSSAISRENSSWSYFRVACPPNSLGRFSTSKNVFMSSTLSLLLGYTNFTFWNVFGSRKYLTAYKNRKIAQSSEI